MEVECEYSEKCPHCGCTDEECLTKIDHCFTTGEDEYERELYLYHCRKCGVIYGSDV
ncbi:unnamed protein product [marine sediment metagenome]|uniref:Uncharacterized protein n=1 Tax=marine sediment metagenome TaxID=412755 RepID=X1KGN0_9ZZZZ